MTVQHAVDQGTTTCPHYCATNHHNGMTVHARAVAEFVLLGECVVITVVAMQGRWTHLVELVSWLDGTEPTVAHLTPDEARKLRDAIDEALALIDAA